MLTKIFLLVAALVVIFLIVVAVQPSDFQVSRSVTISAPPAVVFGQVNDFHNWQMWSPWAKLDPASKTTFEGPAAGVGAIFGWSGNDKIGEGRMTIVESHPNELVRIQLDFVKPFAATNEATFVFTPEPDGTAVTWAMTGEKNFVFKAVGLFMDCDKMMGDYFEKGLASLKALSESAKKP